VSTLEELLAFNDELASLTRAGVPIDLGLAKLNRDPDRAVQQINAAVARRVDRGVSLSEAVAEEDRLLPAIYRTVVSAGLRCGRLPAALEALSQYTRPMLDVRRILGSAFVYPIIICMLAYVLFVGSCLLLWPQYDPLLADVGTGGGTVFHVMRMLRDSLPFWVAIPPVLLVALLFSWFRSGSSRGLSSRGLPAALIWLPGVSWVAADQRCAGLAELLALLVEHGVPLHESLRLAARANGDHTLASAARQMATAAEQGQPLNQDSEAARQFPPFLRWALTSSAEANAVARSLRLAAETYRRRAERRAESLRIVIPVLTCVVFAGGVTLLYCLSVFGPFVRLIRDMS
jgi:general secretion pathway protein F